MVRYFLVNSNRSHRPRLEKQMLRGNYVNALYGPKEKIDQIQKGDIVFLYGNQDGILAYGIADGRLLIRDCEGYSDEEHRMNVDRFRILENPVKPFELSKLARKYTNAGIFYARTVSRLKSRLGAAVIEQCELSKKNRPIMKRLSRSE